MGDKAYSSRAIHTELRRRGRGVTRRAARGLRPVTYKGRNTVERFFNRIRQWRGLATRYDKHALVYRGGAVLAAIVLWASSTP